jgi:hypothetical protein
MKHEGEKNLLSILKKMLAMFRQLSYSDGGRWMAREKQWPSQIVKLDRSCVRAVADFLKGIGLLVSIGDESFA